jgi:uncharacterized glyoxalase superfamily protein PhnB
MSAPSHHPPLSSGVFYRDPKAALRWLEEAFGFEPFMVILDKDDTLVHAEMRYGDGVVMVGSEWSADHKSPMSLDGKITQCIHIQLPADADVDAHCERVRKTGGRIIAEPEDQFYGDRSYRVADPEGHIWSVSQTKQEMTPDQWDAASGLTTRSRL